MQNLTGWLTIDRLNGEGNAVVTLNASALTTLGERNASLKIKTSTKSTILNLKQEYHEEPLVPENIPNNEIWAKSKDGKVMSFYVYADDFNSELVKTILRTDGWTVFTFADDLTYIPRTAFYQTELSAVVIPKTITSINKSAFKGTWLESIDIPDSVITIEDEAFYGTPLTSITIGSGVSSIGERVFGHIGYIDSVSKSYVNTIVVSPDNTAYDSRENCNCLIETSTNTILLGSNNSFIPNTVTVIGEWAFQGLDIVTIDIPDSVKTIHGYAFRIPSLTSITIGSGVTWIGTNAFDYCSSLDKIICYGMTAPSLYSVTFGLVKPNGRLLYPSGATGYDAWLRDKSGYLGYYGWTGNAFINSPDEIQDEPNILDYIPNTELWVKSIDGTRVEPNNISWDSVRLTNKGWTVFTFNEPLTELENHAFFNCDKLESIIIPDSVTNIGINVFYNCQNLKSITCRATVAPTTKYSFDGIGSNGTLYYPQGSDYSSWLSTKIDYLGYYGWTGQPY